MKYSAYISMKTIAWAAVLVAGSLTLPMPASAQTNPKDAMAALPSPAGEHLQQIAELGDNSWLNLGQAAGDPQWGVARGRAWCPKMAAAADLGGAFFCGTGVHGATPDGRYMDDLWFYDANAHRWICLYPGADPKTLKLHLDRQGLEVNGQGDAIPVSYLSHAYCNTTYNPDLKLYHISWIQCPWWGKALPQRWKWLDQSYPAVKDQNYGNVGPIISSPKHPLFWNVGAGNWQRKFVEGTGPEKSFQGVTEYIPSRKQTLYLNQGTVWFYDYASGEWLNGGKSPPEANGYDTNACYDAKRQRLYTARGKQFAWYDIQEEEWSLSEAAGQPENLLACNSAQMFFDTANDVVLWHQTRGPIYVYDPGADTWTNLGNTTPEIPWKRFSPNYMLSHGYYDANLNVHFFYQAGDSNHYDATMLAYRYRRQ